MADSNGAAELARRAPVDLVFADPETARNYAQLKKLAEENIASIQALAREHQAGLDPRSVLEMRLNVLIDTLFDVSTPEGQAARIAYDLRFEQLMAETLRGVIAQVSQAKLAAGAMLSPDQIAALTAQQQDMVQASRNLADMINPNGPRYQHKRVGGAPR